MAKTPYILGIDIGGTGAKAGLFSLDGTILGNGYAEYRMISNVPGQAEHDAEDWWRSTTQAIRQAIAGVRAEQIMAVGVGCTNGLIAVNSSGEPLRSAIMLWDQRSLPEVNRIGERLDSQEVFHITGNPVAPGAYSLPTILWLKHHQPDIFKNTHKLMVPGGYIVGRLTGEFTIDYSRACTTLLFDIRRKQWHTPFLEAFEIPIEKLPRPIRSQEIAGVVNRSASNQTGLLAGTPVVAGCMDTIGASIGAGVVKPGECFVIMGTAARVASPLDSADFDTRFMNCTHVFPETWLGLGAINGVGSSLRWVRDQFGQMEQLAAVNTGEDVYDLLVAQASQSPSGSKGLIYLPYISGERTPIWDPYARALFLGITLGHNRNDFLRSVLEGAAFAIRHVIEILEMRYQHEFDSFRIGGAAARSNVWNQIIADVSRKAVFSLESTHIEVLGAALLAGMGVGIYSDLSSMLKEIVHIDQEFQPNPATLEGYDQLYKIYKELYPDLKSYFQRLAQLELSQVWIRHGV